MQRFALTTLGILFSASLIGCGGGFHGADRSGVSSVPPPPPPPLLTPAPPPPIAQPDVEGPHAREIRAEEALGTIARAAGRLRIAIDDARAHRQRSRERCLDGRLAEIDAIERKASGVRDRLRASLFDDDGAASSAWAELGEQVARAQSSAAETSDCEGEDVLAAGGFGPNDATIRVRPGPVRMRLAGPEIAFQDSPIGGVTSGAGSSTTPAAPPPVSAPPPASDAHGTSLLLRSAQLALAVFEVEKNVDAVETIAKEAGGYLALRGDRQITVRVPKTRFDDTIRRVERLGDVLHRNVSAEDVTDQYVDLELRLKNARLVRARLEKLLEHATVKDAVEIHRELAKVTDEIERLEGKIKLLADRVAFSTVTVTFERTQTQQVRAQALLPFSWMQTMGLEPLLRVSR